MKSLMKIIFAIIALLIISNSALAQINWVKDNQGQRLLAWNDGNLNKIISEGESTTFTTGYFGSTNGNNPSVHLLAYLKEQRTGDIVSVLADKNVNVRTQLGYDTITVDPADYPRPGNYYVTIRLNDGDEVLEDSSLKLVVQSTNHAPKFVTSPVADRIVWAFIVPIAQYDFVQGQSRPITFIGSDQDNDNLTFSYSGALPPGMNFNLLRNAASINGIPTVAGNYKFSVSVTDGRKTFVFPISFLVQADNDHDSVPDVQDNCQALPNADQADNDHDGIGNLCDTPYFTVQAQDSMISENSLLTVNFQVRDPNSEHLTVNAILPSGVAEGLVSPIEATIDSNGLGVVKIKPSWAFVQHPATGRNCCFSRDFDVTLVVSDGGEEIQDSFRVTVTDFLGFTVVRVSWFGGWGLCSEYTI